jgi:hypothetical protein
VHTGILVSALLVIPVSIVTTPSYEGSQVLGGHEHEWHRYLVDQGSTSSLGIDSSSLPHISYYVGGGKGLRLASWSLESWSLGPIDDRDGAGLESSLTLNENDEPVIAFWSVWPHPDLGALKVAYRKDGNWTYEMVDNSTGGDISMALDSKGLPRIAFIDAPSIDDDPQLWFARMSSNMTWTFERIDFQGSLRYPSLDIDSKDHFHISYEELGTELRYAFWNGTKWTIEEVDTEDSVGSWSSIKADGNGRPHIAYYDPSQYKVKYATKVNDTWQKTFVDTMIGDGPSLDLDSLERPHISYHGVELGLRHAYWNGSAWNVEVVDNGTYVGALSSMEIVDDEIHISYQDYGDPTMSFVRYATTKQLPTGGIETNIDIDPDTLNLKSRGKFIIAYIELEGADVRNINASSILLNGAIFPVLNEKYGFVTSENSYIVDHDNDGIMERMVKFNRAEVQLILTPADEVVLTITGSLNDGTSFEGTDTIRVINPP